MPVFAADIPILDKSFHLVPDASELDPSCPEGAPLSYGAVMEVVQRVVNGSISLGIVIFVLMMTWGGVLLITSPINHEARSNAKNMLTNAAIGLLITMSAWLIVDFVMKTLYSGPDGTKGEFGPWNSILNGGVACVISTETKALFSGSIQATEMPIVIVSPEDTAGGGAGGEAGSSKLNIGTAISYASSHALTSPSGRCAYYVRKALAAGGITSLESSHPGHAYQYGSYLKKAGFTAVYTGVYKTGMSSISGLKAGDIVVFQPVAGHPSGHIAIYDGRNWISDYRQVRMSSNDKNYNGGSFTIYRP